MNFKQLIKDSFIYGLGIIFSHGIIFFTLPLYTKLFSPSDYGRIDLVNTIGLLFNIIFIMGMDSTQAYYYMKDINNNISPTKSLSSILRFRILLVYLLQSYPFQFYISLKKSYLIVLNYIYQFFWCL